VTDAEVLAALGLNENLEPLGESQSAQGKPAQAARRQAKAPAGGANASAGDEDQDEEPSEEEETDSAQEEQEPAEDEESEEEQQEEEQEEEEPAQARKGISEMQKRIDKLTAKSKGLEAQLAKAQHPTLQPTEKDPLSDLDSEPDVLKFMNRMRTLRRWCSANWDGGEVLDEQGNPKDLSASDVRERHAYAEEMLQDHVPARISYLKERGKFDELARRVYPALFESESEEAKIMANYLALNPEILRQPNYLMIIGDAISGMRARIGKMQPAKKTTQGGAFAPGNNVKLAPKAIRGSGATQARVKSGLGLATRLHREFLESGDKRKLTAMIESTL